MLTNTELLTRRLGGTLAQAAALHKKNAKATKTGKKVNGYTAAQLAKFAKDSELRAEWTEMLAFNEQLKARTPTGERTDWIDGQIERLRTLINALDAPKPTGTLYSMKLASVGNPDMGQHHREGVASPTFIAESGSLEVLVRIFDAYNSIYDLGGGNVARGSGDVWRDDVLVARISYNGRVWTPEEFPNCKEIDPATGNLKASAQ